MKETNESLLNQKCTILVNSCDAYSDAWYPFFKILCAQWPSMPFPIVLNTETKHFDMKGLQIKTLNVLSEKKATIPWGERLIDALERINTEYVLFLLEDYFLQEPVKDDIIYQCLEWMNVDKNIVTFLLVPAGNFARKDYVENATNDEKYKGFGLRRKKDGCRLCAGPGIWRREDLIKLTKPFEDPWIWELYGSMRSRRHKGEFYGLKLNAPKAFVYDTKRGGAIHRGLWVGCFVRPLLEQFNIDINLEERGVEEDWLVHPEPYTFDLKRIIRNRIKMIRSLYF